MYSVIFSLIYNKNQYKYFFFQMQTIENIEFNGSLYRPADLWTCLLYQEFGVTIPVSLPNAQLMSFIQVFNDILRCHKHIDRNPRKMITLFIYNENIQQWLLTNNLPIPNNIEKIKIFCPSNEQLFFTNWIQRYIHLYKKCTFEIIALEDLNYRLLLYGADLLKKPRLFFPSDENLQDAFNIDYKNICQTLANHFLDEIIN